MKKSYIISGGDIYSLLNLLVSYSVGRLYKFNPLYSGETPKRVLLQTVKNDDEMQHIAAFYQGLYCL